jgi:hypothetical protein
MSGLDLAQIRAQLRAEHQQRPPPRGPMGALRNLLAPVAPPTLFTAPPAYDDAYRAPTPRSEPDALVLDAPLPDEPPLLLDPRRDAFGLRSDPCAPPAPAPAPTLMAAIDSEDVAEALQRLRSTLTARRPQAVEPLETPYLDDDLMDPAGADAGRLYEGVLPDDPPAASAAGHALLERLARTLIDEQVALISRIATR